MYIPTMHESKKAEDESSLKEEGELSDDDEFVDIRDDNNSAKQRNVSPKTNSTLVIENKNRRRTQPQPRHDSRRVIPGGGAIRGGYWAVPPSDQRPTRLDDVTTNSAQSTRYSNSGFEEQPRYQLRRSNISNENFWNRRLLRGHQQSTTQLDKPDDDFRELLDKYKLIKDQLVSLKEIEDRTNSAVQTKSELDRPVVHYVTCPSPWDDKENTNRIDLTLEGTVSENEKNRTAGSKDQQEDDDLDELELRRLALASATAKVETDTITDDRNRANKRDINQNKPAVAQRSSDNARRTRSSKKLPLPKEGKKRYPVFSPVSPRRLSDRRKTSSGGTTRTRKGPWKAEMERRTREDADRRTREEEALTQRRKIQKILTMDDPQKQAEKFLEYLGERQKSSPSKAKHSQSKGKIERFGQRKKLGKSDKEIADNYDQVAMDIDSNDSSPEMTLENTLGFEEFQFQMDLQDLEQGVPVMGQTVPETIFYSEPVLDSFIDPLPDSWHQTSLVQLPYSTMFPPPLPPFLRYDRALSPTQPPFIVYDRPFSPTQPPIPGFDSSSSVADIADSFATSSVTIEGPTSAPIPPPPPPSEPPPPPPLPQEPYPDDSRIVTMATPPETARSEADEEEVMMRAQLLQAMKKRQRAKLEAEKNDISSKSLTANNGDGPAQIGTKPSPGQGSLSLGAKGKATVDVSPSSSRSVSPCPSERVKQNVELSPSSSRSASPMPLKAKLKVCKSVKSTCRGSPSIPIQIAKLRRKPKITKTRLPIHRPVIINLGDDSDTSEDEAPTSNGLLSNLDMFLREARNSMQGTMAPESAISESQMQKLNALPSSSYRISLIKELVRTRELELAKHRRDIIKEQAVLKTLANQAAKYLSGLKASEVKVTTLREQLAAAEKIAGANKQHLEASRAQAKLVKERLVQKRERYQKIEKELKIIGPQTKGISGSPLKNNITSTGKDGASSVTSSPRSNTSIAAALIQVGSNSPLSKIVPSKRKFDSVSVTFYNENVAKKVSIQVVGDSSPVKRTVKMTSSDLAKEKQRLQQMEKEFAEKIRVLKEAQLVHAVQGRAKKQTQKRNIKKMQQIPRLEKIDLGKTDIDSDPGAEKQVIRRRSLIDMNPSTKPNIEGTPVRSDKSGALKKAASQQSFTMPGDEKLNNLRKLLAEKVEKMLSVFNDKYTNAGAWCSYPNLISGHTMSLDSQCLDKPSRAPNDSPSDVPVQYTSALLQFKAYRFSPYFRTKENKTVASSSFSSKLLPKKILCRFDLLGACNDDKCQWQHRSHYNFTDKEILQDIVAYCPSLAGVTDITSNKESAKLIGAYVDAFLKQNQGRMTQDELCLLLVSKVSDQAPQVRPHYLFLDERPWKPKQTVDMQDSVRAVPEKSLVGAGLGCDSFQGPSFSELDNVISEQDERYFMMDGMNVQDMESSVMDNPHDIQMWIKLAYKKLNDPQSDRVIRLEHALNVLSRGLESNRTSPDLWQNYLLLYGRHQDRASDISELCQTALEFAASYTIWWQYLQISSSYQEKDRVCLEIIQFLLKDCIESPDAKSHHLVDLILYKVYLAVHSGPYGRYKTALSFLQKQLKPESGVVVHLLPSDQCLLWLAYIHLMVFHHLPEKLFDPANDNPGHIVSKEISVISWKSPFKYKKLEALFWDAIRSCIGDLQEGNIQNPSAIRDCLGIIENFIAATKAYGRYEDALRFCRQVLSVDCYLEEVWLTLADLASHKGGRELTMQILSEALGSNPYSAKLYHYAADFQVKQMNVQAARDLLNQCAKVFFHFGTAELDIPSLYCKLLNQPVLHMGYDALQFNEEVSEDWIKAQELYMWINYSMLLELTDDHGQCVEVYETALSVLQKSADIATVWISYLQYQKRRVQQVANPRSESRRFLDMIQRCLMTLPSKMEVPFTPGCFWQDYRRHNQIVSLCMESVPNDSRTTTYERFCKMMPANTDLLIQACDYSLSAGELHHVRGLCGSVIYDNVPSTNLWKIFLSIAIKTGPLHEARKLFLRATKVLPFAVTLWKDFLLFEVSHGSQDSVQQILDQCQKLGINIMGFILTLSK